MPGGVGFFIVDAISANIATPYMFVEAVLYRYRAGLCASHH
jgi:hypothetical protein